MADYLSHSLFADNLLKKNFAHADVCRRHKNLYRLGAQGPDLLFYCGYAAHDDELTHLGSSLHALCAADFAPLISGDGARTAYMCGWLAHLVLDEAVHPTIVENSALLAKEFGISNDTAHAKIENVLESWDCAEAGIKANRYDWHAEMPANDRERSSVIEVVGLVCAKLELLKPGVKRLDAAICKLPRLFSLTFDRSGLVRAAFGVKKIFCGDFEEYWHIKRPLREQSFVTAAHRKTYLTQRGAAETVFYKLVER